MLLYCSTNLADNPDLKTILPPKPKMVHVGQFFNKGKENFIRKDKVFNAIMNKCDKQKDQACVSLKTSSLAVKGSSTKQTANGGSDNKGTTCPVVKGVSKFGSTIDKKPEEKPTLGRFGLNKNGLRKVGFGGCVKDMADRLDNGGTTDKCDNGVAMVKNNVKKTQGLDNKKPKQPPNACDNVKPVQKDSLKVNIKKGPSLNKNLNQSHQFPKLNRNVLIFEKGANHHTDSNSSIKTDSELSTDGMDSHNTSTTSEDCMSISTISEDGDISITVPSLDSSLDASSPPIVDNCRNRVSQKRTSSGASYSSDSSDSVRDENKNKVDHNKMKVLAPQSPPTPPPMSILERIKAFENSEFSKPPIPPKPEEMKFKVKEMPFHPKRWHKGNDRYVVVNRLQDALKFFTVEDQRELISSGYSRSRENSPKVTPV